MTKEQLAKFISVVLDPLIEAPLLLVLLFLGKSDAPLWLLPIILLLGLLPPILFLGYGLRRGLITDWETTNRNQRHGLNFVCLLSTLLILFLIGLLGDQFLLRLFFIFLALMLTYTLITFFWKISGHMTANTAFVLVLNLFYQWRFWWLVVLLPLVAWARMRRNKHDLWQILAGAVLAVGVILLGSHALF